MRHILSCDRGTLRDVSCLFDGSRRNRANRDGEGEDDRKERFHGTKEFVPDGSCALTRLSSRLRSRPLIQVPQTESTFIRTRNETLSIIAVGIGNERRSPVTIHGCNTTPIPSGFAQIVGADFPFTRAAPTSWRNNLSSDQQLARKEFPRDGPRTFSGLVIRASL